MEEHAQAEARERDIPDFDAPGGECECAWTKKGSIFSKFPTFGRLGRRRMAGGLEVRLGWSAVPVSRPPPVFLNRCASVIGLIS